MLRLAALTCAALAAAQAQIGLPLEEASKRRAPDFAPQYEGQEVLVQGVVSARSLRVVGIPLLPIQNAAGQGLMIEVSGGLERAFHPGESIEVSGQLMQLHGMPVVVPNITKVLSKGKPPAARTVSLRDVAAGKYLGTRVTLEGRVLGTGEVVGGDYLQLGEANATVRVFLPRRDGMRRPQDFGYRLGDLVRIEGTVSQYSPVAPYNTGYEVLIAYPEAITLLQRSWVVPLQLLLAALLLVLAALLLWYVRERRMSAQRRLMRSLNMLGEDAVSARSPDEILDRCAAALPSLLHCSHLHLYLHAKGSRSLDRVVGTQAVPSTSVSLESQDGALATSLALAFRNRSLLLVGDTRRSPLFRSAPSANHPRTALFVPLFAQEELLGVLEILHQDRRRHYGRHELAVLQHLANQIALSLRLQEQQSMREQLFRSEKLAAAGQLISGVARELREPLEAVSGLAALMLSTGGAQPAPRQLHAIADEANRASEIVQRLVSFTTVEQGSLTRLDLVTLLSGLAEFREREWRSQCIQVTTLFPPVPVTVLALRGQLEQVILSLLIHAEQRLAVAAEKWITLGVAAVGDRAVITLSFTAPPAAEPDEPFAELPPPDDPAVLGVCRGVVQSQGGDIRHDPDAPRGPRFEIELPLVHIAPESAQPNREPSRRPARPFTTVVVDPEPFLQRQLVALLDESGHRVVPVASAEEALDLLRRLRFDIVFCAVRLPGLPWVALLENSREHAGAFVLLTEAYDAELARSVQQREAHLLRRPVDSAELQQLLGTISAALPKVSMARGAQ